jgi:DNA-binding Lrp family transcriptional regulator
MTEISILSREILRELCTNSRVTITELADKYKVSRHAVKERITALEREFGILYTIEPNYIKFGFSALHVVRLKFSKMPKPAEAAQILSNSRIAQFAAITKGDFNMIVFAVAKNSVEYSQWEAALDLSFGKYGISVAQSEVNAPHLGFVPIDETAIEASSIDPIYKKMISVLNKNSRISIRDLSKQMDSSEALTRYYFRELSKTKLVKRYTAVLTKSPLKYDILYFANYIVKSGIEKRIDNERRTMYWKPVQEFPVISEFQIMWGISGADRSFTWASYNNYEEGLEKSVKAHLSAYRIDEAKVIKATVENVVKGHIPIRNLDPKTNYEVTEWYPQMI